MIVQAWERTLSSSATRNPVSRADMKIPIAIVLMLFGVVLLGFGMIASESLGQHVPQIYSRHTGYTALWMMGIGVVLSLAGLATLSVRKES